MTRRRTAPVLAEDEGRNDQVGAGSLTSVAGRGLLSRDVLAWYEIGVIHGIELGRQQLEDEWRGTMEAGAEIARMVARVGSFVDLCERRGEPERAERQRRILRERGVVTP